MTPRGGDEARQRRMPDEGSLLHVTPLELCDRLVELGYTGRAHFYFGAAEGEVGFYEGRVVDARAVGDFGTDALFRMLGATSGSYRLERRISETAPPQSFAEWQEIVDGYRTHHARLGEAAQHIGGLRKVWALDMRVVNRDLQELPDQVNPLLRRVDGRRTVAQVITETPLAESISLRVLAKLLKLGALVAPEATPEDSGPLRSPLSTTIVESAADSGAVPVIGSDLPVRPQWFDEQHEEDSARQQARAAVMQGSVEPMWVAATPRDDVLLPPACAPAEPAIVGRELPSSEHGVPPRPLPEPPDVVEAAGQAGAPDDVAVNKWSSQGAPPPLGFEGDELPVDVEGEGDDERDDGGDDEGEDGSERDSDEGGRAAETGHWHGKEHAFFAAPPLEEPAPVERPPPPPPLPREPTTSERVRAALVLLLASAVTGFLLGRACSPPVDDGGQVGATAPSQQR